MGVLEIEIIDDFKSPTIVGRVFLCNDNATDPLLDRSKFKTGIILPERAKSRLVPLFPFQTKREKTQRDDINVNDYDKKLISTRVKFNSYIGRGNKHVRYRSKKSC